GEFAARSTNTSFFDIYANNSEVTSFSIPSITDYVASEGYAARTRQFSSTANISTPDEVLTIEAVYRHNEGNSTGFVNWIEVQFERTLTAENGYLYFYPPA